jgi:3D (Asp-Asp-Asp) domain-containing protein
MALIAGLVIVVVVIAATLLLPLPERDAAPADTEAPGQSAVTTETSAETGEADFEITPVTPDEEATEAASTPDTPSAEDTASSQAEAPAESLPAGAFDLERIGFSFATGGAGACSVPLEAWRHVAVSRDILESYPCGSEVTITFDEEVAGRNSVQAIVGDTMGSSFSRTVNVYVASDEPANEYGVKTGRLEP